MVKILILESNNLQIVTPFKSLNEVAGLHF